MLSKRELKLSKQRYYRVHRQEIRAKAKLYYRKHRKEIVAKMRQYRKANKKKFARYYRKHRTEIREKILRRRYNLTVNELQNLIKRQRGRCKICRQVSKLMVDHDHKTGVVRGLLCTHCNTLLGSVQDNPKLLQRAIKYLET